jgi:hypothetical protein
VINIDKIHIGDNDLNEEDIKYQDGKTIVCNGNCIYYFFILSWHIYRNEVLLELIQKGE